MAEARAARNAGQREASLVLFRMAVGLQPSSVGLRLEAAADLLQLGRPAEAEAEYKIVLSLSSDHAAAQVGLGKCARLRGDCMTALACFRAASTADPRHIWARIECAAELRALGRVDQAEAEYYKVLKSAPGQAWALLGLALCARARGDLPGSLDLHREILTTDPGHVWARLQAAADLRDLNRLDEAEAEYQRVIVAAPMQVAALAGLGRCAQRRGDRVAALTWFRRAAAISPEHIGYQLACAVELLRLGRLPEAREILQTMLAQPPPQAAVLLNLAKVERLAGNRDLARDYLEKAVAAEPANVSAQLDLAADQREMGQVDDARASVALVLTIRPESAAALLSLGYIERHAGRHEHALAAFARAQALQPGRADPLLQMALEERALGRQARCDALLAQAELTEPDNAAIAVQQAQQAGIANDIPTMHAVCAEALARQPRHLGLNLSYAESLALLGHGYEALEHLAAVGSHPFHDAAIRLKRVSLLRRLGCWHRALVLAREATADMPSDFAGWMERLACEAYLGSISDIENCLKQAPARTPREKARLARMCGRIQEDRGTLAAAVASFDKAKDLEPDNSETHFMLTRLHLSTLELPRARIALRDFIRTNAVAIRLRGRSLNPSQTHLGQVLDEYTLDHEVISKLLQIRNIETSARIEAILRVVGAFPDSTAAAVFLLSELRDQGLVSSPVGCPTDVVPNAFIPRTIVQFWDTQNVPDDVRAIMQSWQAVHPDYQIRLFFDVSAREFIAKTYGSLAGNMYARIKNATQKADVFRLAYLAASGGVYADCDDRCHAGLHTIVSPNARLVLYLEEIGTIGNNFIAAAPRHPTLLWAFRLAMMCIARGDNDTVWLSTGPGLITRAFTQAVAASGQNWPRWFETTTVLGRRELFQSVAIHCLTGYKATDQHWGNAAFGRRPALRLKAEV